jgi:16S rRNA processing protein RimM
VSAAGESEPPADLVELGALRGAYGLKGWVRFVPHAAASEVLPAARRWWLDGSTGARDVIPEGVRPHGHSMLVKWAGCDSKEQADAWTGATLAVSRSEFPPLREGEYYWTDLLGCSVVNRGGVELGVVSGLRESPAGQWLEVSKGPGGEPMLIPLVEQYVEAVDPAARRVRVDWQEDW